MKDALHIMIDLETTALTPDAGILTIGACAYCKDGINSAPGDEPVHFYRRVNRRQPGRYEDPDTLEWWSRQSEGARSDAFGYLDTRIPLGEALRAFSQWFWDIQESAEYDVQGVYVWAKSVTLDFSVLHHAYRQIGLEYPWMYNREMELRTILNLYPEAEWEFTGVQHNALDDATMQMNNLRRALDLHYGK